MSTPKYDLLEIDGLQYKTQFTEKFINRKKWEKPDPGIVTTHIPGSIIEMYVKEGQEVKAGDLLCLLEAMKMHNKILAPISGSIAKVHVNKGDKLPKDALMFEIK
ncbi:MULTISPECIES: acetyl-CoA carboxylase biotin carboxyl carrier protein subunit [Butyricimonas]|uniref:acetyl-CoA carboxylase biotin carboxyl carrier protein subunit n=1 Tax=Butyricimonas TaxID=574697 RepID=UPI0007FB3471|nr:MULTISPECIES: acetyl-CoA carboxylase biotin carboxyl carrier protein subunit [Butyricimonas]